MYENPCITLVLALVIVDMLSLSHCCPWWTVVFQHDNVCSSKLLNNHDCLCWFPAFPAPTTPYTDVLKEKDMEPQAFPKDCQQTVKVSTFSTVE